MRWIVTGASRGIGHAIAEALLVRGDEVVLVARDEAKLDALAARFAGRAFSVPCDLRVRDAERELLARAQAIAGVCDGLVCAAGVARHGSSLALTREVLDETMLVNFTSQVALSTAFANALVTHRLPGQIVHVASTLALHAARETLAYAASKAALVAATKTLALELAPHAVRVNAIAPGVVDTDMIAGRDRDVLRALHPIGRLGTPADVAAAVLYLRDATWVTGSVLVVDGGQLAGS